MRKTESPLKRDRKERCESTESLRVWGGGDDGRVGERVVDLCLCLCTAYTEAIGVCVCVCLVVCVYASLCHTVSEFPQAYKKDMVQCVKQTSSMSCPPVACELVSHHAAAAASAGGLCAEFAAQPNFVFLVT
jgi:hypothetical protein